jgi:hypothetical protein
MIRALFRLLRILGDAKAASRGPGAYGRRVTRRQAHRALARGMRKWKL